MRILKKIPYRLTKAKMIVILEQLIRGSLQCCSNNMRSRWIMGQVRRLHREVGWNNQKHYHKQKKMKWLNNFNRYWHPDKSVARSQKWNRQVYTSFSSITNRNLFLTSLKDMRTVLPRCSLQRKVLFHASKLGQLKIKQKAICSWGARRHSPIWRKSTRKLIRKTVISARMRTWHLGRSWKFLQSKLKRRLNLRTRL